jgi:WD40 repeat protein
MAVTTDRKVVATGDSGGLKGENSIIKIWDAISMQERHTMSGQLSGGITCLAFSPSGQYLAAVDGSLNHNVALYSAATGINLSLVMGSKDQILSISFSNESKMVTGGVMHLNFWDIKNDNLTSRNASWY